MPSLILDEFAGGLSGTNIKALGLVPYTQNWWGRGTC